MRPMSRGRLLSKYKLALLQIEELTGSLPALNSHLQPVDRVNAEGEPMNPAPPAPLRVLLICKTRVPMSSGQWSPNSTGFYALGAFCLKEAVLREPDLKHRVNIEVRSYPQDSPNSFIVREILEARPDVVGFTCQPWNHHEHVRISRVVRQLMPEAKIVHGGPMVMKLQGYLQEYGGRTLDVAVEGEAEETFCELLRHWLDGNPELADIRGLAFFDDEGRPHVTPSRDNPDVSTLPPVMTEENLAQMGSHVLYETSRGCPFDCKFCNWGSQKMKLRTRSPEVIEQDLRAILTSPDVKNLWILDSGLDISRQHLLFISRIIKKYRRPDVFISGYFFLHQKDLSHMEEIKGVFDTLHVGLQTANDNALTVIGRKGLSVHRFDRIFDAVIPHFPGIRVDLIYGLPDLGYDALRESFRFLLKKGVRTINVFRLVAIPGTELAEHADFFGIVSEEAPSYEVYASKGISAEEMLAMQQFKVNVDTLRPLFNRGVYTEFLDDGIDLVDFAEKLHTFIPNFNRRIRFELEGDVPPSPELVDAILDAVEPWAGGDQKRAKRLESLIASTFARRENQETHPAATDVPKPPPPPALREQQEQPPSFALRGFTQALHRGIGRNTHRWSQKSMRPQWERFLAQSPHAKRLGLYVHIPFCERICTYCDCSTGKLDDPSKLTRYLDALEAEVDGMADLFVKSTFDRLYVGGGSPNILSPAQLDRMLSLVRSRHNIADGVVRSMEMDPRLTTREKLRIAHSHGVNRISFGVQSLSEKVLFQVNRPGQPRDTVHRCVSDAFDEGIAEVNLDLLFSLADQSPESFVEEAWDCLSMQPSTLCIQLLADSDFARPYRDEQHRVQVAEQFQTVHRLLREKLEGSDIPYALHERPDTLIVVRDDLWRDWTGHLDFYSSFDRSTHSSVGYGRYAQSWMRGVVHYQNQNAAPEFDSNAEVYSGRLLSPELEVVQALAADLEYRRAVDTRHVARLEGRTALRRVQPYLDALTSAGHLRAEGSTLHDEGMSAEAIAWLAAAVHGGNEATAPRGGGSESREVGLVRVTDAGGPWTIRFERADPERRYFARIGGLGIYYRAEPGVTIDEKRAAGVIEAVVSRVDRLLRDGVEEAAIPRLVAEFLRERPVDLSVKSARAERVGIGARRKTVIAPG